MLIRLQAQGDAPAAEHGILRADRVQQVVSLQQLQEELNEHSGAVIEAARQEALALLEQAREEAEAILATAQAQVDEARQAGYDEGLRQAALDWHDRQATEAIDKNKAVQAMHAKLATIVTSAVERIVQAEERGALYQRALKNVQALTRGASSLTLRVGPDDFDQARDSIATLADLQATGLSVEVKVDAALRPGSCIFESDLGVLDASLQTQLDGLRQAMERAVRRAVSDGETQEPGEAGPGADAPP